MYRVIRFGDEAGVDFNETYQRLSTATRMYYRQHHRHKRAHIVLTKTGGLPGMEDRVIAEWFDEPRKEAP
jgi:hypothetical protein